MQNSDRARRRWVAASAFCILHFAFLGCAKQPPRISPSTPQVAVNPVERLRQDLLDITHRPGVVRARVGCRRPVARSARAAIRAEPAARCWCRHRLPSWSPWPRPLMRLAGTTATRPRCARAVRSWTACFRATCWLSVPATPSIGGRAGDDLSSWVEGLESRGDSPHRGTDHRRRRCGRGAAAAARPGPGTIWATRRARCSAR